MVFKQESIAKSFFTPVLSSSAGLCLSCANWQQAGSERGVFYLDVLLMKPGLAFLQKLTGIRQYYPWVGEFILNASTLVTVGAEGAYSLRSSYDGSALHIDIATLFDLIIKLSPDKVILPLGSFKYYAQFWCFLPQHIEAYYAYEEVLNCREEKLSAYCIVNGKSAIQAFALLVKENKRNLYGISDMDYAAFNFSFSVENFLFESDRPAREAMQGIVYAEKNQRLHILDEAFTSMPLLLDENCLCPSCSQGLTRAYLHHLLQHTPPLAQRYLIQHNVFFVNRADKLL